MEFLNGKDDIPYIIGVNCNISLTWIKANLGMIPESEPLFPGLGRTVRSWSNLPRYEMEHKIPWFQSPPTSG